MNQEVECLDHKCRFNTFDDFTHRPTCRFTRITITLDGRCRERELRKKPIEVPTWAPDTGDCTEGGS